MAIMKLTINGHPVEGAAGQTILEAADRAEIYIPRLCHHPDLPPARDVVLADAVYQAEVKIVGERSGQPAGPDAHCNLCLVEVEGQSGPVNACTFQVEEGLTVRTDTEDLVSSRQAALRTILVDHPHACLGCAQREGCSRSQCSTNVMVDERCCALLGRCELQKVSDFVGIPGDTPKYVPRNLPVVKDDPLFDRDFNLCIGCLRCVRACNDLRGVDVLGAVWKDGRVWVGTQDAGGLREAECRFCGACVEVCPTGALMDKEGIPPVRRDAPAPCVGHCPLGIDIPRYVGLIARGRDREALELIRSRTPFPGILGYVCFHPCEDACRRGHLDQPVSICALKRFVADEVGGEEVKPAAPETGKKVAVIGSGPAGLTAASHLRLLGHGVEVFDAADQPGGMLRQAIPEYRLPEEVLDRELKALQRSGVEFRMNHRIGRDLGIADLQAQGFDVILLAAGVAASKQLAIENAELEGIHPGMAFLRSARRSHTPALDGSAVVIIGGGNVAIDAAMTAGRLGAREVHLACLETREQMPAHAWEVKQAEEEGVRIHAGWGPRRFTSSDGRVAGVDLMRCTEVFDEQGRFSPRYDENETQHLAADHVVVTIGQEVDSDLFRDLEDLKRGPGGTVRAEDGLIVEVKGLFAAGDVVRGPTSVTEAMADGRRVAVAIDRYLGGTGELDADASPQVTDPAQLTSRPEAVLRARLAQQVSAAEQRRSGFDLIERTYEASVARSEAERCLQCHLRQMITPVVLPPERWLSLDEQTVASVPAAEGVFQLLDADKNVIRIVGTSDLRAGLASCLGDPGPARFLIWEEHPMYTQRESELIQRHLQAHGEMPGGGAGGDDLDDLF